MARIAALKRAFDDFLGVDSGDISPDRLYEAAY